MRLLTAVGRSPNERKYGTSSSLPCMYSASSSSIVVVTRGVEQCSQLESGAKSRLGYATNLKLSYYNRVCTNVLPCVGYKMQRIRNTIGNDLQDQDANQNKQNMLLNYHQSRQRSARLFGSSSGVSFCFIQRSGTCHKTAFNTATSDQTTNENSPVESTFPWH